MMSSRVARPDADALFISVSEPKTAKNWLHLDIGVGSGRAVPIQTRRQLVDAEAGRLADLGAVLVGVLNTEGLDTTEAR